MEENTITEENEVLHEFTEQFKHSIENVAKQVYGIVYKEAKKAVNRECGDFQKGYAQGKQSALANFPMWKIAKNDDYVGETTLALAKEFGPRVLHRGQLIKSGWKYIPIKSLKMLLTEMPQEEEQEVEQDNKDEYGLQTEVY